MAGIDHYYAVLRLPPTASAAEIKQAYRALVRLWHPDRFASGSPQQAEAISRLKEINVAYRVLEQFRHAEILSTPEPSNRGSRPSRRATAEHAGTIRDDRTRARAASSTPRAKSRNPFLVSLGIGVAVAVGLFTFALVRGEPPVEVLDIAGPPVSLTMGLLHPMYGESGTLHVKNATQLDAVLSLSRETKPVRALFVGAGDSAKMTAIPVGDYVVNVAQGREWRDIDLRFARDPLYYRLRDKLNFSVVKPDGEQPKIAMPYNAIVLQPEEIDAKALVDRGEQYQSTGLIEPQDFNLAGIAVEGAQVPAKATPPPGTLAR